MIGGLVAPTSGRIEIDGRAVTGVPPNVGYVFQKDTVFPWRTVARNIALGLEYRGVTGAAQERRVREGVRLAGLEGFEDAYPATLSGGMRQRVALMRTLVVEPEILLMDEPFGALDAQTRARMQAHLLEIWRKIDITVIFITHDLDEAIFLADRILVLKPHPGEVIEMIEVPVPRPRHESQVNAEEFLATRRRVDELIHTRADHSQEDEDEAGLHAALARLTDVTDNVE